MTAFERIGGEAALRAIIDDFVERVVHDLMIGFLFARIQKSRLKEMEYQHAAEHLGAGLVYRGRPLRDAHARHRIFGGQFMRRRQILLEVLLAHGVPEDIRHAWIATQDALRGQITGDAGSSCEGKPV